MKIKNLIIVLCLINLTSKAQVHFGVNAGANMGNIVTKINGKKDAAIKAATGYIISGDVNIPISSNLLVQTGLQFESIHNKVNTEGTTSGGGITVKETFSGKSQISYINIPVKLLYKLPAGNGNFVIGAGPYLGIGLGGKSKSTDITETTSGGNTTRSVYDYNAKIKFGNADTAIKRTNLGVGLNLYYILANNISFSAFSNIGLSNINNQAKYNSKTYTYGITVGYVFAKKED
jgi:Outer membrane protein beta-barrel domain